MTDADRQPPPAPAPGHSTGDNRRNHYRVLHVQPEAPLEVIKASYRTLMSRLRLHPDLGGDHAEASMVNQAWAVLGDPERRAPYDLQLAAMKAAQRLAAVAAEPAVGPAGGSLARAGETPDGPPLRPCCALCGLAAPAQPRSDSRCARCRAPLAALPGPGSRAHELLGRRGAVRRDQAHVAMLQMGWPSQPLPVRWRDLSLSGLSFYAPVAIAARTRVHLADSAWEWVAEVVGSRPQGRMYTVHARLLTALMLQSTGVFVHAQA